jgi:hypothetical protein
MLQPLLRAALVSFLIASAGGAGAAETAPPLRIGMGDLLPAEGPAPYTLPGPDPAPLAGLPVLDPAAEDAAAGLLRRLYARGRAAGLAGVVYDNRDRGHSPLSMARFPQLTPLVYGEDVIAERLHDGLAGPILIRAPVIGNASVAVAAGPMWRSMGRLAMTTPGLPRRALQGYLSNHLYVYPEHRDHDAVDLYPANWPYMLFSQGSSYSDQPFLRALTLALAALTPETRARAEAEGLIAPTLQMVLRRSQTHVRSRAAYLHGTAHPTAFDDGVLAPERMVALANAIAPDAIPPLVHLQIEAEGFRDAGDFAEMSERLFDTPAAIARIWRGWEGRKEMLVSAAATRDPNGRALTFDWVLLRGDPDRVRITPLDEAGARAHIVVDWHDRRPVSPRGERLTDRVDIGVFAHNGAHDSAPAFVSISFPTHQLRRYELGPDGAPRLIEIDHDAMARGARFDPALHWSAPWRDALHRDDAGRLTGWTRHHADGRTEVFDAEGARDGQPVAYEVHRPRNAPPVLRESPPEPPGSN